MKYMIYDNSSSCYYLGKTYIYQGGIYPALGFQDEAKQYTSKKRAENAAAALNRKCDGRFETELVKEDKEDGR